MSAELDIPIICRWYSSVGPDVGRDDLVEVGPDVGCEDLVEVEFWVEVRFWALDAPRSLLMPVEARVWAIDAPRSLLKPVDRTWLDARPGVERTWSCSIGPCEGAQNAPSMPEPDPGEGV